MIGVPGALSSRAGAAKVAVGAAAGGAFEATTQGFSRAFEMAGGVIQQYAPAFVRDLVPFLSDLAVGVFF